MALLKTEINAKTNGGYDQLYPLTKAENIIYRDTNVKEFLDKVDTLDKASLRDVRGVEEAGKNIKVDVDLFLNMSSIATHKLTSLTFIATSQYNTSQKYTIVEPKGSTVISQIKSSKLEEISNGAWSVGAVVTLNIYDNNGVYEAFFNSGGGGSLETLPPPVDMIKLRQEANYVNACIVNYSTQAGEAQYGLRVVRKENSLPQTFNDGVVAHEVLIGENQTSGFVDTPLDYGVKYYYRIFTFNSKYQPQTAITDNTWGTITLEPPPDFLLPTFTGQHTIFGDKTKGRIEMYSSGELTLSEGKPYDVFLVGGGGGVGNSNSGGGGGGYTTTQSLTVVGQTHTYTVTIGAGGNKSDGGDTVISDSQTEVATAKGGLTGANKMAGGNGGSGGGGNGGWANEAGDGGSDGSDGGRGSDGGSGDSPYGGTGQHTTTRAFGESNGTLYAGGGGGGGGYNASVGDGGKGGAGGGGDGGYSSNPSDLPKSGTPNTGGGAGGDVYTGVTGGSGIAIIRWGY